MHGAASGRPCATRVASGPVDLRIFIEPQQGASYEQQLEIARASEAAGFDALFRSDHLTKMGDVEGLPGPTDSWVTLGALARETTGIRLGTLVTSATFRHPGLLAVTVAQVDNMSGGRVELGLGTGWYDDEHAHYGIPFPDLSERFERLEEQLEIVRGLWTTPVDQTYSFSGRHHRLSESPALPKPTQPGGPPIVVGGIGPKRTPKLAARHASEFNVPFPPVEYFAELGGIATRCCEEIGRDPDDLIRSVALVVCGGDTDHEVATRAQAIGRSVDELREHGLCGSPAEILDKLAVYAEAGADRVYLQVLDLDDLEHVQLLGEEVLRLLP